MSDSAQTIWRYMDLPKFVLFLKHGLWFSRSDQLEDPWEAYAEVHPYIPPANPSEVQKFFGWLSYHSSKLIEDLPQVLFVNCWHLNENESVGMWKIYGPHGGVAIKSTTEKFHQSIITELSRLDHSQFRCDRVRYERERPKFDFSQEVPFTVGPQFDVAFVKPYWFEYEQEWRAVIHSGHPPSEKSGDYVSVDHGILVDEVYVDPAAPPLLREAVQETIHLCGFNWIVKTSGIGSRPPKRISSTPMKIRDIIKAVEADGWRLHTTRGSHHQYKHPTKPGRVTSRTPWKGLSPGMLRSILKQAGLERKELK